MSTTGERAFFEPTARSRAKAAIEAIEAQTSAEIVVALRNASGDYRAADWLSGAIVALASLVAMLYLPWTFALHFIVVDVVLAFAVGALASVTIGPWRRLLTPARVRAANVRAAACQAFVDRGVGRTRGRSGVLVFVGVFERTVEVVGDVAIDPQGLAGFDASVAELRAAVQATSLERFLAALATLGPVLAARFPHGDDGVNELPDEVEAPKSGA